MVKWHFRAGVEIFDEIEALKLEERFVKTMLDSALIHQKALEHSCIREILYGQTAKGKISVRAGGIDLRREQAFEKQRFCEFGQGAGGSIFVHRIDGLVLDATDAF